MKTQKYFAEKLIAWFRQEGRDLPWRKNRTPYSVWISEIMLQQTVVNAVVPKFREWMKRFPDLEFLGKASETAVLRMWEGLGYYSRARNLLLTSRILLDKGELSLPDNYKDLMLLPGIGPYTAKAVLSLAYDQAYAVMDANVIRVVRRFLGIRIWNSNSHKKLGSWLDTALPPRRSALFNEGLMELGQRICLPADPLCRSCPVRFHCRTGKKGLQLLIPGSIRRKVTEKHSWAFFYICSGRLFIFKQKNDLFKDLWSVPLIRSDQEPSPAVKRSNIICINALPSVVHYYTRYKDRVSVRVISLKKPEISEEGIWAGKKKLGSVPFPSVYRSLVNRVVRDYF